MSGQTPYPTKGCGMSASFRSADEDLDRPAEIPDPVTEDINPSRITPDQAAAANPLEPSWNVLDETTQKAMFILGQSLVQGEDSIRCPTPFNNMRSSPPVGPTGEQADDPEGDGLTSGFSTIGGFKARDVGYFDPREGTPVTVKDATHVFHNVHAFTSRIKVKAESVNPAVLAKNLDACLLGKANNWFNQELSEVTRIGLRNDSTGVTQWCKLMEERFRPSTGESISGLLAASYTIADARRRRDVNEYIQETVMHGRGSGLCKEDSDFIKLIYERLQIDLRLTITEPVSQMTLTEVNRLLIDKSRLWFELYGRSTEYSARTRAQGRGSPRYQYDNYGGRPAQAYGKHSGYSRGYTAYTNPPRPLGQFQEVERTTQTIQRQLPPTKQQNRLLAPEGRQPASNASSQATRGDDTTRESRGQSSYGYRNQRT